MPKASSKAVSSAPFPFVRQFTAPPFFVDIDDAKRKSQLLLDAVQHAAPANKNTPAKRKAAKQKPAAVPAKKRAGKKAKTSKKR